MKSKRTSWWLAGALVVYLVASGCFVASRWVNNPTGLPGSLSHDWLVKWSGGGWGLIEWESQGCEEPSRIVIYLDYSLHSFRIGAYQFLFIATTPLALAGFFILRSITRRLRHGGHANGKAGDA